MSDESSAKRFDKSDGGGESRKTNHLEKRPEKRPEKRKINSESSIAKKNYGAIVNQHR